MYSIHEIVAKGYYELLMLIDIENTYDLTDKYNRKPLFYAILYGRNKIANILLSYYKINILLKFILKIKMWLYIKKIKKYNKNSRCPYSVREIMTSLMICDYDRKFLFGNDLI